MASDHQLEMRIQSEQDEIYARLRPVLADIERIQRGGYSGSADDQAIIRALAGLVKCELLLRGVDAGTEDE